MVRIQRLRRPNKHSGYALLSGETTELRGLVVTNKNPFTVRVDKFTRKPWSKKSKKRNKAGK